MRSRIQNSIPCISMALALCAFVSLLAEETTRIGKVVADFQLKDCFGHEISLADFDENPVVVLVFLGTECPIVNFYGSRLVELSDRYADDGVAFVGLNANTQDSLSEISAFAKRHAIQFPILKDLGSQVADRLQAMRTPEVFVLDKQRAIRYWGRIDDQYGVGYAREKPTDEFLRRAIDELLANKKVSKPMVASVGCLIGRVKQPDELSRVTYSNQIARVLQKHCVQCHRPGEIAPFSLASYDEVVGWSEAIEEAIRDRRMPPWHANPKHGRFTNERIMTDTEKQLVYDWVAKGSPKGDESRLPEPIEFLPGWQLSQRPDVVIPMRDRPYKVSADGTVEYQYFVVDPGFKEAKWIRAAEIIPGNRSVVHHAIVFFRAPEGVKQQGLGWLTAYVPGQSTFELPPHQARYIPAGAKLIFQMHYTPNGSPQNDKTQIGLVFADRAKVKEELITLAAINHDFEIPPHAADFSVRASRGRFPSGAKLHAIAPHMHVRGRSFRVEIADAKQDRLLLDVPNYDFNWQHAYSLREPIPLAADARLNCTARFDNSQGNFVNPDPSITVRWGDQTWQEMMIAFFEVSVPVNADRRNSESESGTKSSDEQQAKARLAARDLIRRFDQDGDGVVKRSETPDSFRVFAFGRFDDNKDKVITQKEAHRAALRSLRKKANGPGS